MIDFRVVIIVAFLCLTTGAVGAWRMTATYKDAKWSAAVEKQNVAAAEALSAATEQAMTVERQRAELSRQLEVIHEKDQQELDKVMADNQRLAAKLGGLRDPGRRKACQDPVPTPTSATESLRDQATSAYLSDEATAFLLGFARECDQVAEYANSCYQWIKRVEEERRREEKQRKDKDRR